MRHLKTLGFRVGLLATAAARRSFYFQTPSAPGQSPSPLEAWVARKLRHFAVPAALFVLALGCSPPFAPPPLGPDHPASTSAPEVPAPPRSTTLTAEPQGPPAAMEQPAAPTHGGHGMHGMQSMHGGEQ